MEHLVVIRSYRGEQHTVPGKRKYLTSMSRIALGVVAVCGAGSLGEYLTGFPAAADTPSISAEDLANGLARSIGKANAPKSVTCDADLLGVVGQTGTCEVVLWSDRSVQANITVTAVNGSNIDYDFYPSLTREQLEKTFAANESAESAVCRSGLEGRIGASTRCALINNGAEQEYTLTVDAADGSMSFSWTTTPVA